MTTLLIDLQRGVIEVEGDEKFVERVYSEFRESIVEKLSTGVPEAPPDERQDPSYSKTATQKATRKRSKTGGPSCASRIEAIKLDDFFKTPRSAGEVREKLKEKGTTYASKNVAAALNNLIKTGKLRRFDDGGWKYQNP